MATTEHFIKYVCEQLQGIGRIQAKKMFGEYMVYLDEKPVLLVCNNTAFVKKLDCIAEDMKCAERGIPYEGAKEHYILDMDNREFSKNILQKVAEVTSVPQKRVKKAKD